MDTEDEAVRRVIEEWVKAIRAGDLEAVMRNHTEDIVMFDVPPPERGARGLAQYRETWPPFLDWVASGSRFEIDELVITAGKQVAFAWALLWCGKPEDLEKNPEKRLRLTLGLRREAGEWRISHEHHSFTISQE